MSEAKEKEFSYPEIYDFPPFFTLQPVDSSRMKQLEQWKQLIMSWHRAHQQYTLTLSEWPLFENKKISRNLATEDRVKVVEYLVSTGNGDWEDQAKTRCKIFFKSPAEWAAIILRVVGERAMQGSIFTVFELHSGDASNGAEFAGLDPYVLLKALQHLEKEGKAQIFEGENLDEYGVKFL